VRYRAACAPPLALIACLSSAQAQTYKATELGLLPGGTFADAYAINNAGQVVGTADQADGSAPAVIWNGTSATVIRPTGPPFGSTGNAINNFGVVVGEDYVAGPDGAFVWSPTFSNTLGRFRFYTASGINDSGRIVGAYSIAAISWASPYDSAWTALPTVPGSQGGDSFALGINNAGEIVGGSSPTTDGLEHEHATLWSGGKGKDLGTLGGTDSEAVAISDTGQIVGWADTDSGTAHAASWSGTRVTDLGTLGGSSSYAYAINSSGKIVGSADTSSGVPHAALFAGGKVIDLNLALSSSMSAYITLTGATGINEGGSIVANGIDSRTGSAVAFLLTPHIEVLSCTQGGDLYEVVPPSNAVSSNVSPNSSGNPSLCATPSSKPAAWYIKTTVDSGATWQWTYTLHDLGLGELPANLRVLECTAGGDLYKIAKPSNSVSSNVSPNRAGIPSLCATPSSKPATWYIKTTIDDGETWQWTYTLDALGLGR
jgi:probable HAF family extracellular repeat protein